MSAKYIGLILCTLSAVCCVAGVVFAGTTGESGDIPECSGKKVVACGVPTSCPKDCKGTFFHGPYGVKVVDGQPENNQIEEAFKYTCLMEYKCKKGFLGYCKAGAFVKRHLTPRVSDGGNCKLPPNPDEDDPPINPNDPPVTEEDPPIRVGSIRK